MSASRSRPPASLYVAGPLSMGYVDFFTFLIPLYALSLGLDASEIGILVGARSILALFLSIHIGVLMDRFGTRRVTLFFVWIGMVLAPLFPLMPGFWPLLMLQLLANRSGEVVTRAELLDQVWGTSYRGFEHSLEQAVHQVRREMREPDWIETVRGIGYRLVVQP